MTQPSKGAALFLVLFGLPFLGGGALLHLCAARRPREFWNREQDIRRHVRLGFCPHWRRPYLRGNRRLRSLEEAGSDRRIESTLSMVMAHGLGQPPRGKPKQKAGNHLLGHLYFLQHDLTPGGRWTCPEDGAHR